MSSDLADTVLSWLGYILLPSLEIFPNLLWFGVLAVGVAIWVKWGYQAAIGPLTIFAAHSGAVLGNDLTDIAGPKAVPVIVEALQLVATTGVSYVKMGIAPLVLCLVLGAVYRQDRIWPAFRVGLKANLLFVAAAFVIAGTTLALVNQWPPGPDLHLQLGGTAAPRLQLDMLTPDNYLRQLVGTPIFDSLARNEIAQMVFFGFAAGLACQRSGEAGRLIGGLAQGGGAVLLKLLGFVAYLAPFLAFAAMANTFINNDNKLALYALGRYLLSMLGILLVPAMLWLIFGALALRGAFPGLLGRLMAPFALAFGTASSVSAYPLLQSRLDHLSPARRAAPYALVIGYSNNLSASLAWMIGAVSFIANATGHAIDPWSPRQYMMAGLLMVMSLGVVGIPRASLVVIAATLPQLDIPSEAVALILAADIFADCVRSAVNTLGNGIAAAMVAKWEGELIRPAAHPLNPVATT